MRLDEFYDPAHDKSIERTSLCTRKPKLTLEILNKLRKMRELQKAEEAIYQVFARKMYGSPEQNDSAGGGLI